MERITASVNRWALRNGPIDASTAAPAPAPPPSDSTLESTSSSYFDTSFVSTPTGMTRSPGQRRRMTSAQRLRGNLMKTQEQIKEEGLMRAASNKVKAAVTDKFLLRNRSSSNLNITIRRSTDGDLDGFCVNDQAGEEYAHLKDSQTTFEMIEKEHENGLEDGA